MRAYWAAIFVVASVIPAFSQGDVPNDIQFVGGSAVPQELWPGNVVQIHERAASVYPTYCALDTAAKALCSAGVWGHDEGPSVMLNDGSVVWYFGDSVTAYQTSTSPLSGVCPPASCPSATSCTGTPPGGWCAYQVATCGGTAGDCLGVDTVGVVVASQASKLQTCSYLGDLDTALAKSLSMLPTYSGSNCPTIQYLLRGTPIDQVPKAEFTYEALATIPATQCPGGLNPAHTLCAGEDFLLGHTATGVFTLPDDSNPSVHYVYVPYQVTTVTDAGFNFRTESILLRSPGDVSVAPSSLPTLSRLYTFSQGPAIPSGALSVASGGPVTWVSGAEFATGWISSKWPGVIIAGALYAINSITGCGGSGCTSMTLSSYPPAGNYSYAAVPNPDLYPGKFMFVAPENVTSSALLSQMPWLSGSTALCLWGTSFFYRNSNVYLGCASAKDGILAGGAYNAGVVGVHYFAGFDKSGHVVWSDTTTSAHPEADAVPLLTSWAHSSPGSPCAGEISVRWIAPLNRFLMTYGSQNCGGLWYRTATAPWGPWSGESQFFPNMLTQGWQQRLMWVSGHSIASPDNFNQESVVELCDPGMTTSCKELNTEGVGPFNASGNPYGPYLYPGSLAKDNLDGTVSVFMNISGFNFYGTWSLGAKFYKPGAVSMSGAIRITPKVSISH